MSDDEAQPDSEPCGPTVVVEGIRQDCGLGVWDNAFEYADTVLYTRIVNARGKDAAEAFGDGAEWMTRWIEAIVGMGAAIRRRGGFDECLHVEGCDCAPYYWYTGGDK